MERFLIYPVLFLATSALANPPADHTIEIRTPEKFSQPKPIHKDDYSKAYEAAQSCGKLCIYIGASWCGACPEAKAAFRANAIASGGACVELDVDNVSHADYVAAISRETKSGKIPKVVVYQKFGDEWQIKCVIGNKPSDIKAAMCDLQAASVDKPCKCVNCQKPCRFGGNCACR